MAADLASPVQADDDLAELLCLALDGTDDMRRTLLLRFALMGDDADRAADLDRIRKDRVCFVTAL